MKSQKPNSFFDGVEVYEIEIQRFKDLNLKQVLDFTEKNYSNKPLDNNNSEYKESIHSKLLKLWSFQVPQYFNTQVLLITEFLKKDDDKKLVRLDKKHNLESALESLITDENSNRLNIYHSNLAEKPYTTAIKVIRFFGRRYRRFKIRYDYEAFFNTYQDYGVFNILFSESFHNQLFGNLKKEKKLTSLSWFNFNLSEWVLKNEKLIRVWWDWISILLDVEYHKTLKKIVQFEARKDDPLVAQSIAVLQNEWTLYKWLIIQWMLDTMILAQTEIKDESHVEMIIRILWEKINNTLIDDNSNVIKLIIHQAFPINLADILIERVDVFQSAINFINEFLEKSFKELDSILEDDGEEKKGEDFSIIKENNIELLPEHYRSIYRAVFYFRILAKLAEKYMLKELMDQAQNILILVKLLSNLILGKEV